jgi:hypothetical protein
VEKRTKKNILVMAIILAVLATLVIGWAIYDKMVMDHYNKHKYGRAQPYGPPKGAPWAER